MNHALLGLIKKHGLLFKRLSILKDGMVTGGEVSYTIDADKGHISYQGNIILNYFWSDHPYPFSGVYAVDPELLKSANLKVGQVLDIGAVKITITHIDGDRAVASVAVNAMITATGEVSVSLAGEYLEVTSVSAVGKAMGFTANVKAE